MTDHQPAPTVYQLLKHKLASVFPEERLISDLLRRLTYGTDASFYRLIPELIVRVDTEAELVFLLKNCLELKIPLTFRAGGTSLSGQALSASVLALQGEGWNFISPSADGKFITLGPAVRGSKANAALKAFGRKIGPDPASVDSAQIGGIFANNASGMCCGTADNSYKTLQAARFILADGTILDTADPENIAAFRQKRPELLAGLQEIAAEIRQNPELEAKIRQKYAIKNTTGYSLNAFIDYQDPIDILQHLVVGSEGTLAFLASVTYKTVPDPPYKASALLYFPSVQAACLTVLPLKQAKTSAVELMDREALRSVENKPGIPDILKTLPDHAAALLIETRALSAENLQEQIGQIRAVLQEADLLHEFDFTNDPEKYGTYWQVRKGLFTAVGAQRKTGSTVIIEDVAFPVNRLAEGVNDLRDLFNRHGYHQAIIFGHAGDGNVHFVFTQDFSTANEVKRYDAFMQEVCSLITEKYQGSLKAEHGTGRNMAPFVELEWGAEAYRLMQKIKHLFDPENLLNPGVILNEDPKAHLQHLKPLPATDPSVDLCIECGFCERMCPSFGFTLSPRQRIVGQREISRLQKAPSESPSAAEQQQKNLHELNRLYPYFGIDTCAACGLCSLACPVGIETGLLIKALRTEKASIAARTLSAGLASHFGQTVTLLKAVLYTAGLFNKIFGQNSAEKLSVALNKASAGKFPATGAPLPRKAPAVPKSSVKQGQPRVIYAPACVNRAMGPSAHSEASEALMPSFMSLCRKAGYSVIIPPDIHHLCCGNAFESHGFPKEARQKSQEFEHSLLSLSQGGNIPVVSDASSCAFKMKKTMKSGLRVLDSIEFLHDFILPLLKITRQKEPVLLHLNCSARRLGAEQKLLTLAKACAEEIIIPQDVLCCGFAGDKGFTLPALNDYALRSLKKENFTNCKNGYSSNRTCEIGLESHSGIPYLSIVNLLDKNSLPL